MFFRQNKYKWGANNSGNSENSENIPPKLPKNGKNNFELKKTPEVSSKICTFIGFLPNMVKKLSAKNDT